MSTYGLLPAYYISRTITFDANGGTVDPLTMTTGPNGKLATSPAPTRGGYIFGGWFTEADGGERVVTDTIFASDTVIYAHWKRDKGGANIPPNNSGSSNNNPNDNTPNTHGNENNNVIGGTSNNADISNTGTGQNTSSKNNESKNVSPKTGDSVFDGLLCVVGIFVSFLYICMYGKSFRHKCL